MPHVNHARGESSRFVFRREHGRRTFRGFYKDKRDSNKWWKRNGNQIMRRRVREFLDRCAQDVEFWYGATLPLDDEIRDTWDLW